MDMIKTKFQTTTYPNNQPINSLKQSIRNKSKGITQLWSKCTSTWKKQRCFLYEREKHSKLYSLIFNSSLSIRKFND